MSPIDSPMRMAAASKSSAATAASKVFTASGSDANNAASLPCQLSTNGLLNAGLAAGALERHGAEALIAADPANDVKSLTVGLVYRPLDSVVFKADYQNYQNRARTGLDEVHVSLGYIF